VLFACTLLLVQIDCWTVHQDSFGCTVQVALFDYCAHQDVLSLCSAADCKHFMQEALRCPES
jgi:hypothetical protein